MEFIDKVLKEGKKNFVFLGEAGCGKSEISINFAKVLSESGNKAVHFFDMDMTKPLFRSRDLCSCMEDQGIKVHFEEQFMDAPTLVGGVSNILRDENSYVVLDVGGDHIGARAIGGFMSRLDRKNTVIYYVLNAFRPWSYDIEHIDRILGEILQVSHIQVNELHLVNNPNFGHTTNAAEVLEGCKRMADMVTLYMPIDFACVKEDLYEEVKAKADIEILPLHLYLTYPWVTGEDFREWGNIKKY